jgi:Protein of unknown function (DUF2384)
MKRTLTQETVDRLELKGIRFDKDSTKFLFDTQSERLDFDKVDKKAFRQWLNTPNPELSGFTPIQVIEKGQVEAVGDMVSAALLGQPS